jgi:hydrophobic/amphiphilic exporter-1 (mainly G- bacteria), HAE1 family
VLNRIRGQLFGVQGAMVIPFAPPPIEGMGAFGGFTFQVLDQSGGDISGLRAAVGSVIGEAAQSPRVAGLFSSFTANDPQLLVDIDRERARSLGIAHQRDHQRDADLSRARRT